MSLNEVVLVVSATIIKKDKVLLIKENKPTAIHQWNFPSGRIEQEESIIDAVHREVKEETGLSITVTGTTGVYQFTSVTNNQVILFHFIAEVAGGSIDLTEDEIVDFQWMNIKDVLEMKNEELREFNVLRQMIQNVVNGNIYSPELFHKQLLSL